MNSFIKLLGLMIIFTLLSACYPGPDTYLQDAQYPIKIISVLTNNFDEVSNGIKLSRGNFTKIIFIDKRGKFYELDLTGELNYSLIKNEIIDLPIVNQ